MKKAISVLTFILFTLTVLYPLCTAITACFGYSFKFTSMTAFTVLLALLSVSAVILDLISKNTFTSKLSAIITPLSLVNAVFCVFKCSDIAVIASLLFHVGCCCYLTVKHGKPAALKTVSLILSVLLVKPVCFICLFSFGFGDTNTVQTVESPSKKYYAQVIDDDQGALGGATLVNVCENSGINAILFKIKKKPKTVYRGNWSEYKNMQIYWKNDKCPVINSVEYKIES